MFRYRSVFVSLLFCVVSILFLDSPVALAHSNAVLELYPQVSSGHTVSGTITPASVSAGSNVVLKQSRQVIAKTVVDGNGNYAFTGVPDGSYRVRPNKSGVTFSPKSQGISVSGADVTGVNFVASGGTTQTWAISGTISPSANGAGAIVTLSGTASGTVTADTNGNYTFTGLTNGTYSVTPSKNGYTFSPSSQSVSVSNANVSSVNFTASAVVAQTYSISGTISGGAGATVDLSGASTASVTADASGNYSFGGLANGTYAITPSLTGYSFTPSSQSATVNGANITGLNFTASASGHSVDLSWTASTTTTVAGYKVYRSSTSGGPYAVISSSPVTSTVYTDPSVTAGSTYYYVVTAVDSSGAESSYSNQATAVIPTP